MQAEIDGGRRHGPTSEELAEIKALKAENRRLREDVDIVRGPTACFVAARTYRSWQGAGEWPRLGP